MLGILNLHGGLLPKYRGADCTFWAPYNGEPEKVGCKLHWIDAGIYTGGLVAHVSPKVLPDDDELKLFWRAVQTRAGVCAELLQRLASASVRRKRTRGGCTRSSSAGWRKSGSSAAGCMKAC